MALLVDFAAHRDLHTEIALARRIIRVIETRELPTPEQLLEHIAGDLRTYLLAGREAYIAAECAARKSADVVLDGTKPVETLAQDLVTTVSSIRRSRLRSRRKEKARSDFTWRKRA